ncbi:uncharacterized protein COX6AL2 isoform X2 [Drosophila kikkawai]|uniref:Uncharacterized protein COX6AL2 isoform X2 n=1 Tax=Drosophila kikkawai TaxID=30033 RepID=A0A6P4IUR4_DROKI|nr:uncharacterized protein LOC108077695 isoform X2 [Drosophila kikkawai]
MRALKLNKCALIFQSHLNLTQNFFTSRLKSDSSKSSDATKKGKPSKDAAPDKTTKGAAQNKSAKDTVAAQSTKDAAPGKATKDAVANKSTKEAEPNENAPPPKDETVISGGSTSKPKPPPVSPPSSQSKGKKENCDTIIYQKVAPKNTSKKNQPLTKIQGGALECKGRLPKIPTPPEVNHASRYQKLSLFLALPLIAILTLFIFGSRIEGDRSEFKNYGYLYKREKRFHFGDGNRSAFHNSHYNALPPDGYEDEIDEEGLGQDKETEEDKKSRLKEFQKIFKQWKKHSDKREARAQKEMAAAH